MIGRVGGAIPVMSLNLKAIGHCVVGCDVRVRGRLVSDRAWLVFSVDVQGLQMLISLLQSKAAKTDASSLLPTKYLNNSVLMVCSVA